MSQLLEPPPSSSASGSTSSHPLVVRITRLRARVRAVLGLYGVGVLVATAVGSMFTLMLLDYMLRLPAAVRLVFLVAWIAALGVMAWRLLITPLSTRLTDQFLASRVENVNKNLSDELMSAFVAGDDGAMSVDPAAAPAVFYHDCDDELTATAVSHLRGMAFGVVQDDDDPPPAPDRDSPG